MHPTNPRPTPTIEGGLEAAEMCMQQTAHKEYLREYKDHKVVSNTIN